MGPLERSPALAEIVHQLRSTTREIAQRVDQVATVLMNEGDQAAVGTMLALERLLLDALAMQTAAIALWRGRVIKSAETSDPRSEG